MCYLPLPVFVLRETFSWCQVCSPSRPSKFTICSRIIYSLNLINRLARVCFVRQDTVLYIFHINFSLTNFLFVLVNGLGEKKYGKKLFLSLRIFFIHFMISVCVDIGLAPFVKLSFLPHELQSSCQPGKGR